MKNKILIIFILLFCISCTGQTDKAKKTDNTAKQETMKNFDIEKFKKSKDKGGVFLTLTDGTKIEQYESDNGYDEIIHHYAPNFTGQYNSYYKSGKLKSTTNTFFNIGIGKMYEYDEKGNIKKEKDEDKKFGKVRYTDILKFLEEKKYLDLKSGKGWYLENGNNAFDVTFDEESKQWRISITSGKLGPGGKTGTALLLDKIYIIDGNSGKVIGKE